MKTIPTLAVLWMELLDHEQGGDHYELMIKEASPKRSLQGGN